MKWTSGMCIALLVCLGAACSEDDSDPAGTGETEADAGDEVECPQGQADCDGVCVSITTNAQNCGGCGNACPVGQLCAAGQCVIPMAEACNGQDDDQDGTVDEGEGGTALSVPCDNGCGQMGTRTCTNGLLSDCTAPPPMPETCDNADNDCDGKIDEGVAKVFYADADGDSFGDPSLANAQTGCSAPAGGSFVENDQDCDDTDRLSFPGAEENCADDKDNDCDREVNDGCACPQVGMTEPCGSDVGLCAGGMRECTADGWSECAGEGIIEPQSEQCSGMDEDCDGMVDENLPDDQWEANETCENFRPLPDVEEDADALVIDDAALYHANGETDHDWYRVTAEEGLGLCVPGFRECGLTLFVDFAVPETAMDPSDYELCLHEIDDDECEGILQTWCTSDEGVATFDEMTRTFSFDVVWSGRCALDSSRDFLVEVRTPNDTNLCQPYGLSLRFEDTETECED
jgi:hypothetical protein